MIRRITHRAVDLFFDFLAEAWATLVDFGPHLTNMAKRTRIRWNARRSMPGWDDVHVVESAEDAAAESTEDLTHLREAVDAEESHEVTPAAGGISFFEEVFDRSERQLEQV